METTRVRAAGDARMSIHGRARALLRDPRALPVALGAWVVLWVAAGVYVYSTVKQLEGYGATTVAASDGLRQTSRGLVRAADGLRNTGEALGRVPFVGSQLDDDVRRTAGDVDRIARTVQATARQARANGEQTRDAAGGLALVLGSAVALVPTLPLVALALLLRAPLADRHSRP
ncbi:MAG: hypothetical protein ACM33B_05440 [Pseudomonadota bacterium]